MHPTSVPAHSKRNSEYQICIEYP